MTEAPTIIDFQRACYVHNLNWAETYMCLLACEGCTVDVLYQRLIDRSYKKWAELEKSADEWIALNPPMFSKEEYEKKLDRSHYGWGQLTRALQLAMETQNCVTKEWIQEVWDRVKIYAPD